MFENQANLYNQDLGQYQLDQQAAAHLGATGRENLRNSLYNIAGQAGTFIGNKYAQSRYKKFRSQAEAAGLNGDLHEQVNRKLDEYTGYPQDDQNYYPQFKPFGR
jgi:hypothetical protein